MKVLITGVTGFLGSALAKKLLAHNYEIIGIKRETSDINRISSLETDIHLIDRENISYPMLSKLLKDVDYIIHTATNYGRSGESVSEVFDANTYFPLTLIEACLDDKKTVFVNTDTILDKYLNEYTLSKNQFLQWGRYFSRKKKFELVNLRLEHVFGPWDSQYKFTTKLLQSCIKNTPEIDMTPGDQMRDFVYIDDVVNAYQCVLENHDGMSKDGIVEFEIGSGKATKIKSFANLVKKFTGSTSTLKFGALPYREGETMYSAANIEPLRRLGWEPKFSLSDGLRELLKEEAR